MKMFTIAAALIAVSSFVSNADARSYQVPAQLLGSQTGSAPDSATNAPYFVIERFGR